MPMVLLLALAQLPPTVGGDPDTAIRLEPWLAGAQRSTEAFGAWPPGPWTVWLHESDRDFEQATGAPAGRAAGWVGSTLHLRPWARLERRDLGALLRHELTHRRIADQGLPRWKEEALCLWAEGHVRPPVSWPTGPEASLQRRLDEALASGTTASQRWAYAWLRAWLEGRTPPRAPGVSGRPVEHWQAEGGRRVRVTWPPERLPRNLALNGRDYPWSPSTRLHFEGEVRFGTPGSPSLLEGPLELEGVHKGWRLTWTTDGDTWIAAAAEGELGAEAPLEAKRALAAVLRRWLQGHPRGNHPDGSLCPLTHCAVVRGQPTPKGRQAVATAPLLASNQAFFTGSQGGAAWSPREAWGGGSTFAGEAQVVPGDPWASWSRLLSPAQVRQLKASVKPGLRPGQRGLYLGPSGPFAVEALRLEAGRRFGWTTWPSNACEAVLQPDGSLALHGRGWGHNVGLCLATALFRARAGDSAEAILQTAFGTPGLDFAGPAADP